MTIFSKKWCLNTHFSASLWQESLFMPEGKGCRRNGIPRDATSQNHYSGDRNSPSRRLWFVQPAVFSTIFLESASLHKISDRNSYQRTSKEKSLRKEGWKALRRSRWSHNRHGSLLPPWPVPMGLSLLHLLSKQKAKSLGAKMYSETQALSEKFMPISQSQAARFSCKK